MFFLKKLNLYEFLSNLFIKIDKRQRFIFATLILSFLLFTSTFLSFTNALYFLGIIIIAVYIFTFFSVLEGINGAEWLMLFIVPICFTIAFNLFFFLLPGRWLTRIPFIIIYAISIYAIMLSQNIFNVGEMKNLQLYKAAFSVNFLYVILGSFLIFNLIFSFKLNLIFNFLLVFILSIPLIMHFYWSINPKTRIEKHVFDYTLITSLILAESALVYSFIPIKANILSLFLTTEIYSVSGLIHAYIEDRLFKERIQEYIFVLVFIFIMTLFTITW